MYYVIAAAAGTAVFLLGVGVGFFIGQDCAESDAIGNGYIMKRKQVFQVAPADIVPNGKHVEVVESITPNDDGLKYGHRG